MLKPFEIRTLMRAYAKDLPAAASDSKTSGATKVLVDTGLIDSLRHITPRGEAFIAMLCATPLPEVTWIDPRTGSSVKTLENAACCPGCGAGQWELHTSNCPHVTVTDKWRCSSCGVGAGGKHRFDCVRFQGGTTVSPIGAERVR